MSDPIARLNAALEGRYAIKPDAQTLAASHALDAFCPDHGERVRQSDYVARVPIHKQGGAMRLIALAVTLAWVSASDLCAQTASDFLGTYDLVRTESLDDSGEWVTTTDNFGPDAVGIIMYDGVASMSVHIVRSDREVESTSRSMVNGYMAYYGGYEVDPERRVVIHKRENHIDADRATEEGVRGFEFDGDLLILTVEPARQFRLFWRKRR